MTSDSNNNLLKILLNRPADASQSTGGKLELFEDNPQTTNTYEITYDQLQYNGYTIGLDGVLVTGDNGGFLYLYDKNGTLLMRKKPVIYNVECNVKAIDIDKDGNLYGIVNTGNTSEIYLAYFNNIFVPDTEGNYDIKVKKFYNIYTAINEISQQVGSNETLYNIDLKKSPINSSFLITWAFEKGSNPWTLLSILYHVNFEGENDYEYKVIQIGNRGYNWIKHVEPVWSDNGVTITDVILSKDYTYSTTAKIAEFYKVTGNIGINNTALSSTLMLTENNYIDTEFNRNTSYTTYFSKNAMKDGDNIYFCANSATDNVITTTIYCYNTELNAIWASAGNRLSSDIYHSAINMVKINGQCFAWAAISQNTSPYYYVYFLHLINGECKAYELTPEGIDTYNGYMGFLCLIQNAYNLYDIIMPGADIFANVSMVHGILIYRANGYNGDPYYNDESVTPAYATLYTYFQSWYDSSYSATMPIFSRDLYNSYKLGNTITSVVQVPYNYLNDTTINQADILSRTANVINENIQPIDKNMYEELYINNQNSYRVYDNNIGSTYNQEATLKVVDNIFNGFTGNYKITKFRINYNDNTYANKDITHIDITNNIGTITMYIYLTKKAKNIQLYDDSFTAPFVTIDISNCDTNKIYQIVQKIKVE